MDDLPLLAIAWCSASVLAVGSDVLAALFFDLVWWLRTSVMASRSSPSDSANTNANAPRGTVSVPVLLAGDLRFNTVVKRLRQERNTLRGISAQDEFGKWAKQRRIVDALEAYAESSRTFHVFNFIASPLYITCLYPLCAFLIFLAYTSERIQAEKGGNGDTALLASPRTGVVQRHGYFGLALQCMRLAA